MLNLLSLQKNKTRYTKYFCLLIFIFAFSLISFAQDSDYSVALIPEALKKNAMAVVRKDIAEFVIKSPDDASLNVTYAITVLNENAIDICYFHEYYDKFRKVNNIKATVYDGNGKKIRRIPADEIMDQSAISGFSIYEDNRAKYINPRYRSFPYTFEYSYTINFNGLLDFPNWYFYSYYNVSVEHTQIKVQVPKGYKFRYYERNITNGVKITNNENFTTYVWDSTNLPAIKYEHFSLPFEEYVPTVYLAPSDFELDNYAGNCESWENFGKWINQLNSNRNVIPLETQNKIKDLVKDLDNDYEKIKTIYNYLQNKTRYVSIQMGIGGYQPFEASLVDKMSYGDCKALSNYMKSMLEIVGIKSNYCLVMAGSDKPRLIKDFPSSQFNHAFLSVPLQNDTLWLECTSQTVPCGYIGDFTDDRDVLLIDDNGGKVVHTKIYSVNENVKSSKVVVDLNDNGNASANISTDYNGLFYEDMNRLISSDDADKKKLLYDRIEIPNFELSGFNHQVIKDRIPVVKENLNVNIRNCGTFMGDRMVLNLNLTNQVSNVPKRTSERKSDIFIRRSFMEVDTIVYKVPVLFTVNKVPADIEIKSDFGEYKAHTEFKNDEIVYVRSFTMNKGTYPLSEYETFLAFFESVITADLTKIVLARK